MSGAVPLVIDCDPGIDDALALALAAASPEVDLRQVTTVSGNSRVEVCTGNALALLELLGRRDVPVAAGATRAIVRVAWHGLTSPHGGNGLGGVRLPAAARVPEAEHAVARVASLLRTAPPRSVTVAAIGPLTNIALLLAVHPECVGAIDRVVVMGGSTGPGNITATAEFNVWTDPEAAQRVLADSGLRITLVGLDVTSRATLDTSMLSTLRASSKRGALLADMVLGYGDRRGGEWPLHDVLAVAAVMDPSLVSTRPARVEVDTGLGPDRGRTACTFLPDAPSAGPGAAAPHPSTGAPPPSGGATGAPASPTRCDVAVDLDVDRFRSLLLTRVASRR